MTALVRHVHCRLEPGGGPHGYLFNLREALTAAPAADDGIAIEVATLPASARAVSMPGSAVRSVLEATPVVRGVRHSLRGEFALRFERAESDWRVLYAGLTPRAAEELLACDLLFAHETLLAERLLALQPSAARARLVLMTHAPGFYAHQIAGELRPDEPEAAWRDARVVRRMREREVETMLAVRAVVWPSPGAADGYPEWRARASVGTPLLPTGVPRPEPRTSRAEKRAQWGAAENQRVALFLGRPHPQKGFDRFVDWADAMRDDPGWLFVQAGGPARHSRRDLGAVRQVGYEPDNGGAYAAADLVVFPNRCAYMDIGLLECLSLGVPTALTPVGGHADVIRKSSGLLCIDADAATFPDLADRVAAVSEPAARAARTACWAEGHTPVSFVAAHRSAAEALLS